eukprot:363330-Chlamydomonas_euryale.AAC.29
MGIPLRRRGGQDKEGESQQSWERDAGKEGKNKDEENGGKRETRDGKRARMQEGRPGRRVGEPKQGRGVTRAGNKRGNKKG